MNFVCKNCSWSGNEKQVKYEKVETCMGNDKIEICPKCGSFNLEITGEEGVGNY